MNNKSTIYNLFWKFSERILAQLVTTIVSIVLARILLPNDYGVISLVMIFINLCNLLVTHGFSAALIQKKDADIIDYSSAFYINLFFTAILYVVLFFISGWVADFFGMPLLSPLLKVMGVRIPLTAINSIQSAYVSKNLQFKKYFWATITGTLISAVVGILMAVKGFGAWALVGQYLTNTFIDTVFLWFTVKWRPALTFSFHRAIAMLKFGWKMLVSALLDDMSVEIKSFMIGKKYSSADLAFYNKGKQFPALINTNVNESISSVLFPVMSIKQDDEHDFKHYFKKSLKLSTFIMFPLLLGMASISKEFILILLTDKWIEAVPYMKIMCFCFLFTPIYSANAQALKAKGKGDRYLIITVAKFFINVMLCFALMRFGVIWIALGGLLSTFISTLMYSIQNGKVSHYGPWKQFVDILPNIFISAIMYITLFFIDMLLSCNIVVLLIVKVLFGMTIYVGLSLILKLEAAVMAKDFFIKTIRKGGK